MHTYVLNFLLTIWDVYIYMLAIKAMNVYTFRDREDFIAWEY
jgi:hypothetical protein